MQTEFTPGPWRAGMSSVLARNPLTGGWASISGAKNDSVFPQNIARANLALAAAAPEMLAALVYVRDMVESGQEFGMSKVLAAISKATTKQIGITE